VLLILAASAVIVTFAVYQSKALVWPSHSAYHVPSGPAIVEPVSGSAFIRSYPVVYNGVRTTFAHYTSRLTAEAVISEYRKEAHGSMGARANGSPGGNTEVGDNSSAPVLPRAHAPMLSSTGSGCSALSYMTKSRTVVGVVAFDNPESGGSAYFVGSMPDRRGTGEDGREPPGVPKPPRSTRTLCIEGLGGLASVLVFYEAWGRPSEIADDVRRGMAENNWTERAASSSILTRNYEGAALLSFSRGHEQCIVGVDQGPKTGKIIILTFWAERPWLPTGTAL